jgi:hypothetical protein
MQVGPSIHGLGLSVHLIKPTSIARLRIKVNVFPCPWISEMAFGSSARLASLGEAVRPGFCPQFASILVQLFLHSQLIQNLWNFDYFE